MRLARFTLRIINSFPIERNFLIDIHKMFHFQVIIRGEHRLIIVT